MAYLKALAFFLALFALVVVVAALIDAAIACAIRRWRIKQRLKAIRDMPAAPNLWELRQ